MDRAASLTTIASVIAAFGSAMISFRIQRESLMRQEGQTVWLPFADCLLIAATLLSLLLVMLPIILSRSDNLRIPTAAAASSVILLAGYIFAILGHYRIFFDREFIFWGEHRHGQRGNPEPAERIFASIAIGAALEMFFHEIIS